MRKELLLLILVVTCKFSFGQEFTELYGDYLGQHLPGDTALVFARDLVSTDDLEHSAAMFSPDGNEVFWHVNRRPGPENPEWENFTKTMSRIDGRWTKPELSAMKHPIYTPDGQRIYFIGDGNGPYYADRQNDAWGEWQRIDLLDRYPEIEMFYITSVSSKGTLYFTGKLEGLGTLHIHAIYRSELVEGRYSKPEILPQKINLAPFNNWTPYIAPDESYLIFSTNRTGSLDDHGDLFLSFRRSDGDWSEPISMGTSVNTPRQERLPSVSLDGRYLFFTRWTPDHDQDVFWISANIINRLKEESTAHVKKH